MRMRSAPSGLRGGVRVGFQGRPGSRGARTGAISGVGRAARESRPQAALDSVLEPSTRSAAGKGPA
jgi:hypothetical protein